MMTLYLVFEALEKGIITLEQALPVSKRAAGMAPSKLGLDVGDSISVEDAILALTTKSANDAAEVVAEALDSTANNCAKLLNQNANDSSKKRSIRKERAKPRKTKKSP